MTEKPIDVRDDLADRVADEFEAYRQPDEFKDVPILIENRDAEHPTLIVHVDREDADSLADRIDEHLREQRGGDSTGAPLRHRHPRVSDGRLTAFYLQFFITAKLDRR